MCKQNDSILAHFKALSEICEIKIWNYLLSQVYIERMD